MVGGGGAININLGEQFLKGTNNRAKIVLVRIFVYTACVDSMEIVFKYWQHLFALSTSLLPKKKPSSFSPSLTSLDLFEQRLRLRATSTCSVCLLIQDKLLFVFPNCKLFWIKASEK